jgi:uncharacterized protein
VDYEEAVMRAVVAIAVVLSAFTLSIASSRAQTATPLPPAENLAAAHQLVDAMRATDEFKALLPSVIQNMKNALVQNRPEMEKNFDAMTPLFTEAANAKIHELTDQVAAIYARHFSVAELHAITAFYQSPVGQKLVGEHTTIARETMAAGREFGQALGLDIQTRALDALHKQRGGN